MNHEEFLQFTAGNRWTFARTYASFCPHEYVVKDRLPENEKKRFEEIVAYIREKGFTAVYGRKGPNRYYTADGYYYWTMGAPVEETAVLNRARLSDYVFCETEDGLTVKYRG